MKMKRLKEIINRQVIDYFIWGVSTTLVNLVLYTLLCLIVDYRIANFIAIIVCKIYAYVVNKYFVFRSRCGNMKELFQEVSRYVLSRGFTGLVDYVGVLILVEVAGIHKLASKYFITVLVMFLNYILGKYAVFRRTVITGSLLKGEKKDE